jgi:hypothetical protein
MLQSPQKLSSLKRHSAIQIRSKSPDTVSETPVEEDQETAEVEVCEIVTQKVTKIEVPIPENFFKFDWQTDSFKINTVGIYNTHREKSFYRIIAHLCGQQHTFNTPDWKGVT